jgi:hypothetical protein
MTDNRVRQTQYAATITPETLAQLQGVLRLWDSPRSKLEGARVVAEITIPTSVHVIAEQFERFSEKPERAKIRSQGKEGWVLAVMVTRES